MAKADKLKRKLLPPNHTAADFQYRGRPSTDVGDFGEDVGIADGACVNQFGDDGSDKGRNNCKYYHGGVVQSTKDNSWWCYFQYGRIDDSGESWTAPYSNPAKGGDFRGGDFQFYGCESEAHARKEFAAQMRKKSTNRLERKDLGGGVKVWVSKTDKNGKSKDGYIIQALATRTRGLPDAYTIKDDTGVTIKDDTGVAEAKAKPKKKTKRASSAPKVHPQVVKLAQDLVGGTKTFARAAAAATGVTPTLAAITEARDVIIPQALQLLAKIGDDLDAQLNDKNLQGLSRYMAGRIPVIIPRGATQEDRAKMLLLSKDTIMERQQDLDAFEAALKSEDFETEGDSPVVDYNAMLGALVDWIDPQSELGRWLEPTFRAMSNNRHYNSRGRLVIKNMFKVVRPDRDALFVAATKKVAAKCRGRVDLKARLQPPARPDVSDISDEYDQANVFLGIHGTRAVNIHPIMSTNLRLPKSLRGVVITGSAFGSGIYAASDWKKSYNYCGLSSSYYGGGGTISGRGFFMFLQDIIMGQAYKARSVGSWQTPPNGCDSIAAYPDFMRTLQNDEHIIFDPSYQRIRYLIEGEIH